MKSNTEIFVSDDASSDQLRGLIDFFGETGNVEITIVDHAPAKSTSSIISIVVQIVGTWAAEKYLLNPLASHVSEWISALRQAGTYQNSYRKFAVKLTFEDDSDSFDIDFLETSNLELLKQVWELAERAVPVRQAALSEGVQLTTIQFLMDNTSDPLVVGSDINGNSWVVDLARNSILPDIVNTGDVWVLSQLIRHNDYLLALQQGGYALSDDELEKSQLEIVTRKADIQLSAERNKTQESS